MRVRYTPHAFADREAIFNYLSERDPAAAHKVRSFIKEKIASLNYAALGSKRTWCQLRRHLAMPPLYFHSLFHSVSCSESDSSSPSPRFGRVSMFRTVFG